MPVCALKTDVAEIHRKEDAFMGEWLSKDVFTYMRLGKALKTFCGNCACKDSLHWLSLGMEIKRTDFSFLYSQKDTLTKMC